MIFTVCTPLFYTNCVFRCCSCSIQMVIKYRSTWHLRKLRVTKDSPIYKITSTHHSNIIHPTLNLSRNFYDPTHFSYIAIFTPKQKTLGVWNVHSKHLKCGWNKLSNNKHVIWAQFMTLDTLSVSTSHIIKLPSVWIASVPFPHYSRALCVALTVSHIVQTYKNIIYRLK